MEGHIIKFLHLSGQDIFAIKFEDILFPKNKNIPYPPTKS